MDPEIERASVLVGVGASAGGLEAMTRLLAALPADLGVAVLFVQHLDPSLPSAMVPLLSRSTAMRVESARSGEVPQANIVYVAPPGAQLTIDGGTMQVASNGKSHDRPVDTFLCSLADSEGPRAIGIVLSGSGSDGLRGLTAIRAAGGLTIVQDETATFDDMPRAAIAAGVVDLVLPPHAIAAELAAQRGPAGAVDAASSASARPLAAIVDILRRHRGVDFSAYKVATLRRRISRRMNLRRVDSMEAYAALLAAERAEVDALFECILIRVTEFFRDPAVFEHLRTVGLPTLARTSHASKPTRVWVVGCSTGEEAYSLAMTILDYQTESGRRTPIQIFATDINDTALSVARAGCYSTERCAGVGSARLERYFVPTSDGYRIRPEVKELCVFSHHDITRDPPLSRMDLVSCRNLLIYLGPQLQARVVPTLHYALRPCGLLLLGTSETIGRDDDLFESLGREFCTFARRPTSRARLPDLPMHVITPPLGVATALPHDLPGALSGEADRWVVDRYAPAGVVVDADMRVLDFRGDTSAFLAHGPGPATFRLLDLARPRISALVADAVTAAAAEGKEVVHEGTFEDDLGVRQDVCVRVVPLDRATAKGFLILFEPKPGGSPRLSRLSAGVRRLGRSVLSRVGGGGREEEARRDQLTTARSRLHGLLDDHQAKTEQLTAANEEVRSSNEELQSTNEELQTAKEEVLASNEELSTVNEELELRNKALARSVDDLSNLLAGTNIPILMVDRERQIRWFTPSAARVLDLRQTDMGREIDDARLDIGSLSLVDLVDPVLADQQPREQLTLDGGDRWWRVTVSPYRRSDESEDGAVIALVDVDALKRAEAGLLEERTLAQWIVQTVNQPLVAIDAELSIVSANRAYCESLATTEESLLRQRLGDVAPYWDEPPLREWLHAVMVGTEESAAHELASRGPPPRQLALRAHKIFPARAGAHLLIAVEDVTARRLQEQSEAELLGRVLAAQAQEREHIARELHDETGQALSALLVGLQAAFAQIEEPRAAASVAKLREQARSLVDAVGRLARGLHPPSLAELGLGGAIRELADGFARTHAVTVNLQLGGERHLPDLARATQLALYRVVQEGLTNVAKHARATSVSVRLDHADHAVMLRIADDGRGFEPTADLNGGLGLQLMRRRIALLHGTLALRTVPDDGTVLDIVVPAGAPSA